MDGGQLFFLNEGKGPNEWPAYFYKHLFYLEVVAVLILIHHCNALSGVIVGTEQDEKNSNFVSYRIWVLLRKPL